MPVRPTRGTPLLVALLIPAAATLTACGSSNNHEASGAARAAASSVRAAISQAAHPGTASSSAGSGGGGGSNTGSSGRTVGLCSVLTAPRASQIVGKSFTSAKPRSYPGVLSACTYSGNENLLQISASLTYGSHELSSEVQALTQIGHPPTPVSGVGDKAFAEPDPKGNPGAVAAADTASFGALFGQVYIEVGGMYVTQAQGKQIVELIHAAM